jgi:hypothetical protein
MILALLGRDFSPAIGPSTRTGASAPEGMATCHAPYPRTAHRTNAPNTLTESLTARKCDDPFPSRYTVSIGTSTIRRHILTSTTISHSYRSPSHPNTS